jgi:hypothetical protein
VKSEALKNQYEPTSIGTNHIQKKKKKKININTLVPKTSAAAYS